MEGRKEGRKAAAFTSFAINHVRPTDRPTDRPKERESERTKEVRQKSTQAASHTGKEEPGKAEFPKDQRDLEPPVLSPKILYYVQVYLRARKSS